jgi:hypothetical protein
MFNQQRSLFAFVHLRAFIPARRKIILIISFIFAILREQISNILYKSKRKQCSIVFNLPNKVELCHNNLCNEERINLSTFRDVLLHVAYECMRVCSRQKCVFVSAVSLGEHTHQLVRPRGAKSKPSLVKGRGGFLLSILLCIFMHKIEMHVSA